MADNAQEKKGYQKTIVCLANSRKISGRCIVGKEILHNGRGIGEWIRPVSSREKGEVSEDDRRYKNGVDPCLLDIIRIELLKHKPQNHQIENHLIDHQYYWVKVGVFPLTDVPQLLDEPETLWMNGYNSSAGINNKVPADLAGTSSTYLIALRNVELLVGAKAPAFSPKRSVRAKFIYHGVTYILDVTDPKIERYYLRLDDGEYIIHSPYLCISLAEAYDDGYCYKLVAAIIYKS